MTKYLFFIFLSFSLRRISNNFHYKLPNSQKNEHHPGIVQPHVSESFWF
jgi:hypothetical protein